MLPYHNYTQRYNRSTHSTTAIQLEVVVVIVFIDNNTVILIFFYINIYTFKHYIHIYTVNTPLTGILQSEMHQFYK